MKRLIYLLQRSKPFPYIIINIILTLVLLGIMIYSAAFSATKNHYPIRSSLEILKEGKEISTGLSRSFSELIRGRIRSARDFNEHGPRIFLFFLLQLLMRPVFSLFYLKHSQAVIWIYLDAGLSIMLFMIAFFPFMERLAEIMN